MSHPPLWRASRIHRRQLQGRPNLTDPNAHSSPRRPSSWGYDRISGALSNLGINVSNQTVGNILQRHGISPTSERVRNSTWHEFIRQHRETLWACDFFTAEIWPGQG